MAWRQIVKITPKRLEAIGAGLVFSAAFWEATMLREAAEGHNISLFVELNEKLKYLWWALETNGDLDNIHDFVFRNSKSYLNDFNYIENFESIKRKDLGLSQYSEIRWVAFGLGALMVVAGKWWDGAPK